MSYRGKPNILGFFSHSVVVCAEGGNCELLLDKIISNGITPKWVSAVPHGLVFTLSARHYKRLRSMRKGTGCRLYLLRKAGPLFLFKRLYRRRSLALSILLFFVSLYLLSNLVWRIDTGSLSTQQAQAIKSMLFTEGIYPGSIANSDHFKIAEQNIMIKSNSFAYLKLNFIDGRLTVESKLPEYYIDINSGSAPLFAAFDGIIHDVKVYEGYGMVKVNQSVSEGQLLVDNIKITDDNQIVTSEVYAKITAYGETSYSRVQPLEYSAEVLTEENRRIRALHLLSFRIPLYFDAGFNENYQRNTMIRPVSFLGLKLPASLEVTELTKMVSTDLALTPEQASLNAQRHIEQQFYTDYSYPKILDNVATTKYHDDSILVEVKYKFIANLIEN